MCWAISQVYFALCTVLFSKDLLCFRDVSQMRSLVSIAKIGNAEDSTQVLLINRFPESAAKSPNLCHHNVAEAAKIWCQEQLWCQKQLQLIHRILG